MSTIRMIVATFLIIMWGVVPAAEPVNINTADAAALAEVISGVGEKRAEAIVAYRAQHGPFASVDELTQIRGIGEKIIEQSRDKLTVKDGDG